MPQEDGLGSAWPPDDEGAAPTHAAWKALLWVVLLLLAGWHAHTLAVRGIDLGPDIQNYQFVYDRVGACGCLSPDPAANGEYLWLGLALGGHWTGLSFTTWLTLVILLQSALWMGFGFQGARALGATKDVAMLCVPLTLLIVQMSPFIQAGQTNILRSGLAVPVGALATLALAKGRRLLAATFTICAIGIHTEVGVILLIGLVAFAVLPRRWAVVGFSVLSVLYAGGLSDVVSGAVVPESIRTLGLEYGSYGDYQKGIRLDFLAFTAAELAAVTYLTRRDRAGTYGAKSASMLSGLAFPFLLVGGLADFADRWLQPFWSIASVLLLVLVFRVVPKGTHSWLAGCAGVALIVSTTLITRI